MTREEYVRGLREIFTPAQVLSRGEDKTVLRLRHRRSGRDLVLRSYPGRTPVYDYLKETRVRGFPEVYDVISCSDGRIVLEEWVEGTPLSDLLERSLFTYRAASKILVRAAGALQVLHGAGFVHRDIKPKNILLTPSGEPVILDLETARPVKTGDDTHRLGTAGFAAPEQFVGKSDPRSDVYALGVTLCVMLTGRHPSEAMPRGRAGRIVRKATATDPADRYADAGDFADAL